MDAIEMSTTVPAPARSRNRRGEGARLRDEIVEAASELLAEVGDEKLLSMRAVARRVGVTPPSIYLHFADKTTLVEEVLDQRFDDLREAIQAATDGVEDPVEALRRGCLAYLDYGRANPGHYRVLFEIRREGTPTKSEAGRAAFDTLVAAIGAVLDAGRGRDAHPELLAVQVWSAMHGVVSLTNAGHPYLPDHRVLLEGILAGFVGTEAPEGVAPFGVPGDSGRDVC